MTILGQATVMARFVYRFRNETAHPEDVKLQRIADEMEAAVLKSVTDTGSGIPYGKDLVEEVRCTIKTGIIKE
jgi:ribosomal protein L7/L12